MAGPWEKYQQSANQKPWEKYQGATIGPSSGATEYLEEAPAVQQMPPDVSESDRLKVKNFSNSPEASVKYLQEKYPQYKVMHHENNIYFEKPGQSVRYVLDPNLSLGEELTSPGELAKDVGDVAYDIPAGVATTAAGTAGALAAGIPTGGSLAIPGSMLASGGTSAGLEATRQKLGQLLGLPQNVSGTDVAVSGAAGALAPLLFGPGASMEKEALKAGLNSAEAGELAQGAKGVVQRSFPSLYSKMSGIPEKTIETASQNLSEIKRLGNQAAPQNELAQGLIGDVNKLKAAKDAVGKTKEVLIKNSQTPVILDSAKAPYLNKISDLERLQGKALETSDQGTFDRVQSMIDTLKEELQKHFEGYENSTSAEGAQLLKENLKAPGQVVRAGSKGIGVVANEGSDLLERLKQDTAKQAGKNLSSQMKSSIGDVEALDNEYASISNLLKKIGPSTKSEDKALSLVKSISKGGKEALAEDLSQADKDYGTNFVDKANLVDAFNTFRKRPEGRIVVNEIKRRVGSEAAGAGLGGYYGYKHGGPAGAAMGGLGGAAAGFALGSPAAARFYLNFGNAAEKYLRPGLLPTWNLIQSNYEQNDEDRK